MFIYRDREINEGRERRRGSAGLEPDDGGSKQFIENHYKTRMK